MRETRRWAKRSKTPIQDYLQTRIDLKSIFIRPNYSLTRRASFEVALFAFDSSAEGRFHRSLGQRPRTVRRNESFWPKAILTAAAQGE